MPKTICHSDPDQWFSPGFWHIARYLNLSTKPLPCPRPRVSKSGHAYYSKPYAAYKASTRAELEAAECLPSIDEPVAVAIDIRCPRPAKTELVMPRGDVDNFAKSVLDALTSIGVWLDDGLVSTLVVRKRYADAKHSVGSHIWIVPETP